ncbi:MAG: substrate-binding domain-containing protein, partial [Jannaschia sp.]
SGLADVLLPAAREATGLDVQLLVVGTGQALRLGAAGDVDAVLTHARAAEEAWLAEGHGTTRSEIMSNDFILIGPGTDPAGVAGSPDIVAALVRIAEAGATFLSRGDDSGTHALERSLWPFPPQGPWYRETGSGMGATLTVAAGLDGYTLTDRGSWLNFGARRDLRVLHEGDARLLNVYAYLPVAAKGRAGINEDGARRLLDWLSGAEARGLIDGYRIDGRPLFTAIR